MAHDEKTAPTSLHPTEPNFVLHEIRLPVLEAIKIHNLYQYVSRHLTKYNVRYVVACGTMLGVLRNQQLPMPWDDDVDLIIHPADESKLQAISWQKPRSRHSTKNVHKPIFGREGDDHYSVYIKTARGVCSIEHPFVEIFLDTDLQVSWDAIEWVSISNWKGGHTQVPIPTNAATLCEREFGPAWQSEVVLTELHWASSIPKFVPHSRWSYPEGKRLPNKTA